MKEEKYIGKIYSELKIVSFDKNKKFYIRKDGYKEKINIVNCICSCGNFWKGNLKSLKAKQTKSCGCLFKKLLIERNTSHKLTKSTEYSSWAAILRARVWVFLATHASCANPLPTYFCAPTRRSTG